MAGLPTISGEEAIKAFQNAGWPIVRTGSSSLDELEQGLVTEIPDREVLRQARAAIS